ncbi:MAG: hypothetical protein R2788_18260 [Saprospiraceae bacterium]
MTGATTTTLMSSPDRHGTSMPMRMRLWSGSSCVAVRAPQDGFLISELAAGALGTDDCDDDDPMSSPTDMVHRC